MVKGIWCKSWAAKKLNTCPPFKLQLCFSPHHDNHFCSIDTDTMTTSDITPLLRTGMTCTYVGGVHTQKITSREVLLGLVSDLRFQTCPRPEFAFFFFGRDKRSRCVNLLHTCSLWAKQLAWTFLTARMHSSVAREKGIYKGILPLGVLFSIRVRVWRLREHCSCRKLEHVTFKVCYHAFPFSLSIKGESSSLRIYFWLPVGKVGINIPSLDGTVTLPTSLQP